MNDECKEIIALAEKLGLGVIEYSEYPSKTNEMYYTRYKIVFQK